VIGRSRPRGGSASGPSGTGVSSSVNALDMVPAYPGATGSPAVAVPRGFIRQRSCMW
jgi:hypothetical protein